MYTVQCPSTTSISQDCFSTEGRPKNTKRTTHVGFASWNMWLSINPNLLSLYRCYILEKNELKGEKRTTHLIVILHFSSFLLVSPLIYLFILVLFFFSVSCLCSYASAYLNIFSEHKSNVFSFCVFISLEKNNKDNFYKQSILCEELHIKVTKGMFGKWLLRNLGHNQRK